MCRELMFEQLIIISHQLRIPFKNPDKSIYVRINIKIAFFSFLTNIEIVSFKKKKRKETVSCWNLWRDLKKASTRGQIIASER